MSDTPKFTVEVSSVVKENGTIVGQRMVQYDSDPDGDDSDVLGRTMMCIASAVSEDLDRTSTHCALASAILHADPFPAIPEWVALAAAARKFIRRANDGPAKPTTEKAK